MVRLAASNLSQLLRTPELRIELITLLLRTSILPIRAMRMSKSALLPTLQLLQKRLPSVQTGKHSLRLLGPKNRTMLHTRARKALDLAEIDALIFQPLQDQVDGFQPHGRGSVDLALAGVGEDALCDAVFGAEVGVEVDFGLVPVFQGGVDDDAFGVWSVGFLGCESFGGRTRTFQLLGGEVKALYYFGSAWENNPNGRWRDQVPCKGCRCSP